MRTGIGLVHGQRKDGAIGPLKGRQVLTWFARR